MPADAEVRHKVEEVLSRSEFRLDSQANPEAQRLFLKLLEWLLTPLIWFFELLSGLPVLVRWVIVAFLTVVLVLLVAHIVWSFMSAIRGPRRPGLSSLQREREVSPEEWEERAQQAEAEGDHIGAVRLLFAACLQRIRASEKPPLRRGITNRELLRRFRATPLEEPLRVFTEAIDTKWYGYEPCASIDYQHCREQSRRIQDGLKKREAERAVREIQHKRTAHALGT